MSSGGRTPQVQDRFQEIMDSLLAERVSQAGFPQVDPFDATMARVMGTRIPLGVEEDGSGGFFSRAFDALTPQTPQELGLLAAGTLAPVIAGFQALAEIPGLFTSMELPTDRAADFLKRMNEGILSRSEEAALRVGVSPDLIADSHLLGELFGFVIPVVAAFKGARIITGIKAAQVAQEGRTFGNVVQAALRRNFILDSTAGAIFGGVLSPADNLADRATSLAAQSAVFGVSGLAIGGTVFAAQGIRLNRARVIAGREDLAGKLLQIEQGGIVFTEEEALKVVQLMNEEGFLANSPAAQDFMAALEFDNALVASIRGAAEAGQTRGIVQDFANTFKAADGRLPAVREQFANLKFDIVARKVGEGVTYDLHFGLKGLSNTQKRQLGRAGEGRYTGQLLAKGGSTYEYVRRSEKAGRIVVRTADGKTTTLLEKGVNNLPYAVEEIVLPTAGQALYTDFREATFARMVKAMGVEGAIDERVIVKGLKEGTFGWTDDASRQFEIGGAITHPEELGITFAKIGNPDELAVGLAGRFPDDFSAVIDPDGVIWLSASGREGHLEAAVNMVRSKTGMTEEAAIEAIQTTVAGDVIDEALAGVTKGIFNKRTQRYVPEGETGTMIFASGADDLAVRFLREGKYAGDAIEPVPIRNMVDAFDEWARARNLDLNVADIEAFRANFAQRFRNDLWAKLPDEDLKIFQSIREETLRLADDLSTPELRAGVKGLFIEPLEGGRVALRDINTGARVEVGSIALADDVVNNVIRSESDPFGLFLSDGAHGMPGYTTGFDPTDGIFAFEEGVKVVTIQGPSQITFKDFLPSTPTAALRNRSTYFDQIERLTGVPLNTQGFLAVDEATLRAGLRYDPVGKRIDKLWKGITRVERVEVADFWTGVEGTGLVGNQLMRAAREAGLNNKQIRAFNEARKLYDLAAQELGLPESRIVPLYYSRIRPALLENKSIEQIKALLSDQPIAVQEYEFWALLQRKGELANLEMDPLVVMHKHFRGLYRQLEVAPAEGQMRRMLDLRIRDLPEGTQQEILSRGLPRTTKNSHILPDEVLAVGKEYMNNIQGHYTPGFASARRFMGRVFEKLGMKGDPEIFDQFINTWLSIQYGAALGLRFATMNRNAMQSMWTMYTRVGGEFGSESLALTMSQKGFNGATEAGAIRPVTASVALGDAVFQQILGDSFIRGSGPWSNAGAAAIRRALRLGKITRKTAEKFLIPYGSGDQVNRAWAYWWQRLHTEKQLNRFDAGTITWDKFIEEGLPFFSNAIKKDFRTQFDKGGREAALRFIGKQAADEAHFIYGSAAAPTWMQRPFGRLAGVFGQWPLWLTDLYFRRRAHATPAQQIKFGVRTLALMGLTANMGFQSGVNMWNWMAPSSLAFTGGPTVDIFLDFRDFIDAPIDRKQQAGRRLMTTVGSLSFPGQLFYRELLETGGDIGEGNLQDAAYRLLLGRPVDNINFTYDLAELDRIPLDPPPESDMTGRPSIDQALGIR